MYFHGSKKCERFVFQRMHIKSLFLLLYLHIKAHLDYGLFEVNVLYV